MSRSRGSNPFDHVIVTALHVVIGIFFGAPVGYLTLVETVVVTTGGTSPGDSAS